MLCMPARTTPSSDVSLAFAQCRPAHARSFLGLSQRDGPLDDEELRKVNFMKNTVTLVGFVGNTPEVRTAQSGAAMAWAIVQSKLEEGAPGAHTMKLEDINKAFDLMHAGESIRSVVVF